MIVSKKIYDIDYILIDLISFIVCLNEILKYPSQKGVGYVLMLNVPLYWIRHDLRYTQQCPLLSLSEQSAVWEIFSLYSDLLTSIFFFSFCIFHSVSFDFLFLSTFYEVDQEKAQNVGTCGVTWDNGNTSLHLLLHYLTLRNNKFCSNLQKYHSRVKICSL